MRGLDSGALESRSQRALGRRAFAAWLGLCAYGLAEGQSWAGSYLDCAALLINEASRDNDFSSREVSRYRELVRQAEDEEQLFRGVLRQLGWALPSTK